MAIFTDGDTVGTNVVSTSPRNGTDVSASVLTRPGAGVIPFHRFKWPSVHRRGGIGDRPWR